MAARSKMLSDLQRAGKLDLIGVEPELKAGANQIEKLNYQRLHTAWMGQLYLIWKRYGEKITPSP